MKIWTAGRWLWTRTIGSTLCGELVDSALFYFDRLLRLWGTPHLLRGHGDAVRAEDGWEIVMTPVTYRVVGFLKRVEHEDYYDRDTNFTPFSLKA